MFWLQVCLIVVFFGTHSTDPIEFCISQNPCKCTLSSSSVIDLSSIGSSEHPLFREVVFDYMKLENDTCDIPELYSYNPCSPFDSSEKHTSGQEPCLGAAGCIKYPGKSDGTPPAEYAIGLQSSAKFFSNGSNNYITYTVPGTKKSLQVILTCDNATDHVLNVLHAECGGEETILELVSKCACPDGCQSSVTPSLLNTGLSTGSILLIAFFTILIAYFIVGIVWNFCNGAHGLELLPNSEFWNDLPTLIMEGVILTCSCFSRKSAYGEV